MASASSSGLDVPNWRPWGLITSQISHSESLVSWFEGRIFEVNLQSVVVTHRVDRTSRTSDSVLHSTTRTEARLAEGWLQASPVSSDAATTVLRPAYCGAEIWFAEDRFLHW